MNFLQIKETCIYSTDLDAAREFYHGKLGLEVISHLKGKHIFFRAGSSVLLCFNPEDSKQKKTPPAHYAHGKYHFAFEVAPEEYEHHKAEIISKGISIVDTVVWDSGPSPADRVPPEASAVAQGSEKAKQESFYFEDGLGNILEIVPVGIW